MNERIQELMEQAMELVEGEFGPLQLNEEKFAELLIQRCTELSDLAEKNCLHPATIIKRHFGVE